MNKKVFLLCSSLFFGGCEQADLLIDTTDATAAVFTQSTISENVTWDACSECRLPSGEVRALPWSVQTETTIPDDIRTDVKADDYWIILDTTVDIIGYSGKISNASSGINYILLYNTRSGMLKGFYYAETMIDNNYGYWQLSTSSPTKLFNFASYFAEAMDGESPQIVNISNVTRNGITAGFTLGWNCFMLELAYDPDSYKQLLNIDAFALNKGKITLSGAYQSTSTGMIVTSLGAGRSKMDGVASGIGSAAKKWLLEHTKEDKGAVKIIGKGVSEAVGQGIKGLISTGLYKIFGSVMGTSKTAVDLNFTTNGKTQIEGEVINAASGMIHPFTGLKLGSEDLNLGLWNLSSAPVFSTPTGMSLRKTLPGPRFYYYEVKYEIDALAFLVVNPSANMPGPIKVSPVIFDKYLGKNEPMFVSLGNPISPEVPFTLIYSDGETIIRDCPPKMIFCFPNLWPNAGLENDVAVYLKGSGYSTSLNAAIKIVFMSSTNGGIVYSTKTFWPHHKFYDPIMRPLGWSKEELEKRGFHT